VRGWHGRLLARNHNFSRAVGPSDGVTLTLPTLTKPHASKSLVFGYTVFAKVPDRLLRNLSEKGFRGVMVGYPSDAPGYREYNHGTRRITTVVHVMFEESINCFGISHVIDSTISDASHAD
jgi:hypothetical protein